MNDVSLISAFIQENNYAPIKVLETLSSTDFNWMNLTSLDVPTSLLNYLDSSIEYLTIGNSSQQIPTKLKFKYQKEEILLTDCFQLGSILSSGTIRGIKDFHFALSSLKRGALFIIDEIENHYNKAIVKSLINLYLKQNTNPNGACLIFSTHFPELLDLIERNDQVYFSKKKENKVILEKIEDKIKRNDLKKSEIYNSSYLGGTAPSYDAYATFVDDWQKKMKENNLNE